MNGYLTMLLLRPDIVCACVLTQLTFLLSIHTLPRAGHCKTGFSGLVDDMHVRTSAVAITSSSVGDGVHW